MPVTQDTPARASHSDGCHFCLSLGIIPLLKDDVCVVCFEIFNWWLARGKSGVVVFADDCGVNITTAATTTMIPLQEESGSRHSGNSFCCVALWTDRTASN